MSRPLKLSCLALCLAAVLAAGCAARNADDRFEEKLRQTLREHPEIVVEALGSDPVAVLELAESGSKLRRTREAEERFLEKLAVPLEPAIDPKRPALGAADAPVTVVSYTDFFCAYCAKGAENIKELMRRHPGTIRYIAKHVPMSEDGEFGARIFEALAWQSQDLAWEFYTKAFASQDEVRQNEDRKAALKALAASIPGVDAGRLDKDLADERLDGFIRDDFLEFQGFGFRGVPVYLYNGAPLEGSMPLDFLEKALDRVLHKDAGGSKDFSAEEAAGGACVDCLNK